MSRIETVILDFSGACREQEFWKEREHVWIGAGDIQGTNCYCDEEAAACLRERISPYGAEGVHFIDSGNYHYMSRFWLEKVNRPFCLILFDNHTDMQPPAFGGLLSCGGWAASALEELPFLEHLILIGPDEAAWELVPKELCGRVSFLSREKLPGITDKKAFLESCLIREDALEETAIYLSIDKDILCKEDAATTWSQGDMRISELLDWLACIFEFAEAEGISVLGADICGEEDRPFESRGKLESDFSEIPLVTQRAGREIRKFGRDLPDLRQSSLEEENSGSGLLDMSLLTSQAFQRRSKNDRANESILRLFEKAGMLDNKNSKESFLEKSAGRDTETAAVKEAEKG